MPSPPQVTQRKCYLQVNQNHLLQCKTKGLRWGFLLLCFVLLLFYLQRDYLLPFYLDLNLFLFNFLNLLQSNIWSWFEII